MAVPVRSERWPGRLDRPPPPSPADSSFGSPRLETASRDPGIRRHRENKYNGACLAFCVGPECSGASLNPELLPHHTYRVGVRGCGFLREKRLAVQMVSVVPSPASHPRLCKEPGDVCVSRSGKQSGAPGHGHEGQECGGAEGPEGGDPGLPGVVTTPAPRRGQRETPTRSRFGGPPLAGPQEEPSGLGPRSRKKYAHLRRTLGWLGR